MKTRKLNFADFAENELTRNQKTRIVGGILPGNTYHSSPTVPNEPTPTEPIPGGPPTGDIRDDGNPSPVLVNSMP